MKGRLAKLRRVQELFTEGTLVVLEKGGSAEPFWVSKPSAFERDEALKDARAAKARRGMRFDSDADEQLVVASQLKQLSDEDKIDSLIGAKGNEFYVRALDEIRTRKDWAERIAVIDRAGLEDDRDATDADREVVSKATREYMVEVASIQSGYEDELREELIGLSKSDLDQRYIETWRDMTSFEAFMEARRVTEIFFALRFCEATRVDDQWIHDGCDHRQRLLESRDEVFDLPDPLVVKIRDALEELQMSPREAGNSGAPVTSSGSSERPSEAEDSAASGQVETSPEPVGT